MDEEKAEELVEELNAALSQINFAFEECLELIGKLNLNEEDGDKVTNVVYILANLANDIRDAISSAPSLDPTFKKFFMDMWE